MTRELDAQEYEVSIFGGYEDENNTSEDITETMLSVMQVRAGVSTRHVANCDGGPGTERSVPAAGCLHGARQHGHQGGGGLAQGVRGRRQVSGDWPRAGHVTTVLISHWSGWTRARCSPRSSPTTAPTRTSGAQWILSSVINI